MRYIGGPPPHGSPEIAALVASSRAARKYLRYYQRGFLGFVVATVLCIGVEHLLPRDLVSDAWLWWSRVTLAIASAGYAVAPYSRRLVTLWKEHIRPRLDLLSDRR